MLRARQCQFSWLRHCRSRQKAAASPSVSFRTMTAINHPYQQQHPQHHHPTAQTQASHSFSTAASIDFMDYHDPNVVSSSSSFGQKNNSSTLTLPPQLTNVAMDTQSQAYQNALQRTERQVADLNQRLQAIGGSPQAQQRHLERGKLLPKQRLERLVDPGTPLLELGALAGGGFVDDDGSDTTPVGAGILTAIGRVAGRLVMMVANDATVKGGTYFPMTVKKHLRAQQIAQENKLPCIYLVDSGGAYLPLQRHVFPDAQHFGRIFFNQANMSSQGIPQIAVVCGSCTAGGAYVPSMSDETVIVQGNGTIFLGGPPLVQAATGQVVSAQDLGGAAVHTQTSGVADRKAETELEALQLTRDIVASLGRDEAQLDDYDNDTTTTSWEEPLYDPAELRGVVPVDPKQPMNVKLVLARILDGSRFHEFKPDYGTTLVTGFGKLYGQDVGIIANNGILFSESAQKGAHFVELCCQRGIPLLFLQNITGFMVGSKVEHEGIAKHGAKLVTAVATAQVPKLTLVLNGSFGAGNYGMCGRAYDPRFLFTWPNARIGVMGGEQAANVLWTVHRNNLEAAGKTVTAEQEAAFKQPILDKYERESSAYFSTAHLWDDGIIDPADTRRVLGMSLAVARRNGTEPNQTKFGLFRM